MAMFGILVESLLLVFGSLLAALCLIAIAWLLFRTVRHPELSASVPAALLACALAGLLPRGTFAPMVAAFGTVAIVPLWVEGRAWRAHRQA